MSDQEAIEASDEQDGQDESDGPDEQGGDELPDVGEEDMADFSEVADIIEDEGSDSESSETEGEEGDEQADESSDESDETGSEPEVSPELSIGDLYCNALGLAGAVSRHKFGSATEDERDEMVDEYGDMARQIELDRYVDQWIEQNRHLDSLGPGQAVLLGTIMWGGMILVDDPDLASGISEEVKARA